MYPVAARITPGLAIGVTGAEGVICHTAIYWGIDLAGQEWVIDCCPENGVGFRLYSDFSQGRPCNLMNYKARYEPSVVLARALEALNKPYRLFSHNCQHFTSWCVTDEARSEQLEAAIGFLGLFVAAIALQRAAA